jgi:hypothetical protein
VNDVNRQPFGRWRSLSSAGLILGPASWALNTQLNYSLLEWACSRGANPTPIIAAVLALSSLGGAVLSWLAWQRHDRPSIDKDGRPHHLLSGIGVAAGILFAVVIGMQGIGGLLLQPCLR